MAACSGGLHGTVDHYTFALHFCRHANNSGPARPLPCRSTTGSGADLLVTRPETRSPECHHRLEPARVPPRSVTGPSDSARVWPAAIPQPAPVTWRNRAIRVPLVPPDHAIRRTRNPRAKDISPDGQRFLIIRQGAQTDDSSVPPAQITVVLNWFDELQRLVPTDRLTPRHRRTIGP